MGDTAISLAERPLIPSGLVVLCAALVVGCGMGRVSEVSPAEIPALEEQLADEPEDGALLLRYAAALFSAERCDSAMVVARAGMMRRPKDALGPLVLGQCLEQGEYYDEAIDAYRGYLNEHSGERGATAVRSREMLAVRSRATMRAREALARESERAQVAADPQIVAVLPLQIVGDSQYQPLSRGLAQMLTSDLGLLQTFRMVERLQLGALLNEMELGQTQQVDQGTAVRVGRLLQAGRMVQGTAAIPEDDETRLEASVVLSNGEVTSPTSHSGPLRDLLDMEKEVVVDIAGQLGYTLSEAERQLILENGTRNLAAFLAYSRGLIAEDMGDYSAAAVHFSEAVQADPGFQAAREGFQANDMAPVVEAAAPTEVTVTASAPATEPEPLLGASIPVDVTASAIGSTLGDIAATQSEHASQLSDQTETNTRATGSTIAVNDPVEVITQQTIGIIRIVFRLP
jgi:tetratricopeptide (TPR) repeat protein